MAFQLGQGNLADSHFLDILSKGLTGKLFGNKGYISKNLEKKLFARGLELFTTLRSNMKQKLMGPYDRILLRKRSIIETVNEQLKNISQIEHIRHRSQANFMINLLSGLAASCIQPKKPALKMSSKTLALGLI